MKVIKICGFKGMMSGTNVLPAVFTAVTVILLFVTYGPLFLRQRVILLNMRVEDQNLASES
ncbi:MAG: hypothetical protein WC067_05500 [Candidatus Methanomethylophilaceae archaeon]